MTEVRFYHLTATPLEQALPDLLEKALARRWRVLLRCGSREGAAFLDGYLWTWRDEAFLPHGTAEMAHAGRQPIYLTAGPENPNGAEVLMLAMGARAAPAEMAGFVRVCLLFDGADAPALAAAREDWKAVVAAGYPARYWAQEAGRWTEKARSG